MLRRPLRQGEWLDDSDVDGEVHDFGVSCCRSGDASSDSCDQVDFFEVPNFPIEYGENFASPTAV